MSIRVSRPITAVGCSATLMGIALLAGCTGDEAALNSPGAASDPKPAESISRLDAPYERSVALSSKLNTYRLETFGTRMDVAHKNVLYTAAYRHATYLQSINSVEYNPRGGTGLPPGEPTDVVTAETEYAELREETEVPTATSIFPANFTNADIWSRVMAVVGGPSLLGSRSGRTLNEFYIFNGDVRTLDDEASEFRGFNLDTDSTTDPDRYRFDAIDNLWYSRRGRVNLMRADLRYFGYGHPSDSPASGGEIDYPWPIMDGQFRGVVTTITPSPAVAQFGHWPDDGNVDVNPYGLDTDFKEIITPPDGLEIDDVVPNQYSGPPIHVTIPVLEPFLQNETYPAGGVYVLFRKSPIDLETGEDQAPPDPAVARYFTAIFRGLNGGVFDDVFYDGGNVPGEFDYEAVGNSVEYDEGDEMRNGELLLIPTQALEPNSWYDVGVYLRTPSYRLPDEPFIGPGDTRNMHIWSFKTNGNVPPWGD